MCIKWYYVLEYVYYYVLKCICKYVFEYIKYVYVHIYEPSTCFKWYLWIIGNFCMSVSTDILPEIDFCSPIWNTYWIFLLVIDFKNLEKGSERRYHLWSNQSQIRALALSFLLALFPRDNHFKPLVQHLCLPFLLVSHLPMVTSSAQIAILENSKIFLREATRGVERGMGNNSEKQLQS